MNLKKVLFGDLIDFQKQSSSYFNLDSSIVVIIVFILSEVLRRLNSFLAYFGIIILFIVAFFEKKSNLVKFCCIEYGLFLIGCELLIISIGLLIMIVPILWLLFTIILVIAMILNLIVYLYLLSRAYQYKGWKIPWLGNFVLNKIMKVDY